MKIQPVILAGGEGKRLAPLSTPSRPKPFIPLPDGQSLLEKTCRRLAHDMFLPPIIIGRSNDRYALMNHARAAGVVPSAILLEQEARNTAFAIACAVRYVNLTQLDTMLAILPADHMMEDVGAWQHAVAQAAQLALRHQTMTLIGIEGQAFSPELGYMSLEGDKVIKFIEKPISRDKLGGSESFLVNSGQFIGISGHFSAILTKNAPEIWSISNEILLSSQKQWEYEVIGADINPITAPSFDRAVVEKETNIYAARLRSGWRDLGTIEEWLRYSKISIDIQMNKPKRTDRPWGYFEALESTSEYTTKRLYVYPGCRLSRQRHFHRSEHWTVESGEAYIEKDQEKMTLGMYESIKIPPATWHRLVNATSEMLIIKEIQYGVPDEMDIERDDDDYGRI
jgi:mannose-1-phosphate guanylyltransferase